jgi:osmoprotectant transport system permease protein
MAFLGSVIAWLMDPVNWQGADGVPVRVGEHLLMSGTALLIAVVLALPLGIWLGHIGRGAFFVINVTNIGRAIPSIAVLALSLPLAFGLGLGLGFWPTVLTLAPLGIPLILINSYAAIRAVDPDTVAVARGLGMHEWQVLRHVELPLAMPVILAGIRNAAVNIVATAPLGALVAGGGLGRYIVDGLARLQYDRVFVGALLVALVAIATEVGLNWLERWVAPPIPTTSGR